MLTGPEAGAQHSSVGRCGRSAPCPGAEAERAAWPQAEGGAQVEAPPPQWSGRRRRRAPPQAGEAWFRVKGWVPVVLTHLRATATEEAARVRHTSDTEAFSFVSSRT